MLDLLFCSKARIEILKAMLLEVPGRVYLRELVAMTRLPQGSVQRELANLTKAEVLTREASGRQVYYRVNDRCPILPELRSMLVKTVGVAGAIRDALAPVRESICVAFIFGSFAKGDFSASSDIDVFVVGDTTLRRVVSLVEDAGLAREINPIVVTRDELRARVESGDHFSRSIVDTPKIYVIGDDNDFAAIAR